MSIPDSLTILSPNPPLPAPAMIKKKLIFSIKDKAFSGIFLYSFDKCLQSTHSAISAALSTGVWMQIK